MKMHGSKEMYAKSRKAPKEDKAEETAKEVTPAEKEATAENGEVGGMPVHDVASAHVLDRHQMYAKHEQEHAAHKGGDKKEMHERHQSELKALHKRHDKEMKTGE